ncbi:hypothetical protein [Marinomonas sp. 2405UD68-3]|uniref:hypothetical protein n=1 Tax=Marinomonas sp. 2405UD68-3 TaxID=3391835 RepID=UPI0039C8EA01
MLTDTVQQAYCLEQMGVVNWVPKESTLETPSLPRPFIPWVTEHSQVPVFQREAESLSQNAATSFGFQPVPMLDDPEVTQKTVTELKEELLSNSSVIVEDLQPIEEFAVDISPSTAQEDILVQSFSAQLYSIERRLLIITHIPQVFDEYDAIENLTLKMSKALLRHSVQEWQSARFSWPEKLHNSYFVEKTDWMLGALESFVERYIEESQDGSMLVVAGTQLQKVMDALPTSSVIASLPRANIVSLPELYRIPELKRDAWNELQRMRDL